MSGMLFYDVLYPDYSSFIKEYSDKWNKEEKKKFITLKKLIIHNNLDFFPRNKL